MAVGLAELLDLGQDHVEELNARCRRLATARPSADDLVIVKIVLCFNKSAHAILQR